MTVAQQLNAVFEVAPRCSRLSLRWTKSWAPDSPRFSFQRSLWTFGVGHQNCGDGGHLQGWENCRSPNVCFKVRFSPFSSKGCQWEVHESKGFVLEWLCSTNCVVPFFKKLRMSVFFGGRERTPYPIHGVHRWFSGLKNSDSSACRLRYPCAWRCPFPLPWHHLHELSSSWPRTFCQGRKHHLRDPSLS